MLAELFDPRMVISSYAINYLEYRINATNDRIVKVRNGQCAPESEVRAAASFLNNVQEHVTFAVWIYSIVAEQRIKPLARAVWR